MVEKVNYAEEWDWLIVLDACRYDFFSKVVMESNLPKPLVFKPVLALESCTLGVLNKMPKIHDSICVTSHPFVIMHQKSFDKVVDAGWDDILGTCSPQRLVGKVLFNISYIRGFKRKIIWFIQPHYPFIGETKLNIPLFVNKDKGWMPPQEKIEEMFMKAYANGVLWKAYEDNLKLVLKWVRKLLTFIRGKIVITSDHGEGLGKPVREKDKPVFAHPCEREELELLLIPWYVIVK